jgi:hypothetical protein
MDLWTEQLALTEAAALQAEALEAEAEQRFDVVFEAAELRGDESQALASTEFRDWMAARADTDAAWGRWAQTMEARLDARP